MLLIRKNNLGTTCKQYPATGFSTLNCVYWKEIALNIFPWSLFPLNFQRKSFASLWSQFTPAAVLTDSILEVSSPSGHRTGGCQVCLRSLCCYLDGIAFRFWSLMLRLRVVAFSLVAKLWISWVLKGHPCKDSFGQESFAVEHSAARYLFVTSGQGSAAFSRGWTKMLLMISSQASLGVRNFLLENPYCLMHPVQVWTTQNRQMHMRDVCMQTVYVQKALLELLEKELVKMQSCSPAGKGLRNWCWG